MQSRMLEPPKTPFPIPALPAPNLDAGETQKTKNFRSVSCACDTPNVGLEPTTTRLQLPQE